MSAEIQKLSTVELFFDPEKIEKAISEAQDDKKAMLEGIEHAQKFAFGLLAISFICLVATLAVDGDAGIGFFATSTLLALAGACWKINHFATSLTHFRSEEYRV